jgi:DNA-binding response OmpR family regulator
MRPANRWRAEDDNGNTSAGRRNRILVAEDEEDTLLGLQKTLAKRGYAVDVARDGVEAAEKVRSKSFDVVVSDLRMPRLDGMELLHVTKEADKSIIFIVITGYGTVDNAVEAMRLGAADYINKPFSPSVLIGAIEKALHKEYDESPLPEEKPSPASIPQRQVSAHTWYIVREDGTVVVGADTEFYQASGEIVYCDLPFESDRVAKGEVCARLINAREHVPRKLTSPVSGTVIEVNDKMLTQPWLAQKDPYGEGWLFAVVPSKPKKELRHED